MTTSERRAAYELRRGHSPEAMQVTPATIEAMLLVWVGGDNLDIGSSGLAPCVTSECHGVVRRTSGRVIAQSIGRNIYGDHIRDEVPAARPGRQQDGGGI